LTIREALEIVLVESPDPYSKSYAKAGLELGGSKDTVIVEKGCAVGILHKKTGDMMVGEEMKVQILYVLSNLQTWRGPKAREVKEFLRKAAK
jgi:hypothetical protein